MGNTRTYAREADKARRKEEGTARNAEWASLTTAQKIASLDARLGKGIGAKRQRKLLAKVK